MNILLTLFLLFLIILLFFSNLKYRTKFKNYYESEEDNNINVILNNYIAQRIKYIIELIPIINDNMSVKLSIKNN